MPWPMPWVEPVTSAALAASENAFIRGSKRGTGLGDNAPVGARQAILFDETAIPHCETVRKPNP